MRATAWKWTAIALVLLAGTGLGVAADRMVGQREAPPRPPSRGGIWFDCGRPQAEPDADKVQEWRSRWMERMQEELELSDEQVTSLREVYSSYGLEARGLWRQTREHYCGIQSELDHEVSKRLSVDQLERYRILRQRQHERRGDSYQKDRNR